VAVGSDAYAGVFFSEDVRPALVDVLAALWLVGIRAAHEVPVRIILFVEKRVKICTGAKHRIQARSLAGPSTLIPLYPQKAFQTVMSTT
jgi:hypothetical protein